MCLLYHLLQISRCARLIQDSVKLFIMRIPELLPRYSGVSDDQRVLELARPGLADAPTSLASVDPRWHVDVHQN